MVFQTSNMNTQDFIKEIHHALMENHCLSLVKKKVDIHLLKLMTNNPRKINIKICIFLHFTQKVQNLVGLTLSPNIHYKLLKMHLHEFMQVWSKNSIRIY